MTTIFLTTTIPYVNAEPHLGFALEAVQADVLARHHRRRGDDVRLLTGTDDNSLKNVLAAERLGVPVAEFVDRNAAAFEALRTPLDLSFDDFLRTSRDPRHRAGVERLWHACAHDLYRARYEGLYCVGCEHYVTEPCPEHPVPPQPVAEENWFFRLSRYAGPIRDAIVSGRLRIEPAARRNEVLAFLDSGLRDLSVSRSTDRARGWGIPVPGDPGQVVYVWWDALGNYVSSLDYGTGGPAYQRWWAGADRRVHLVGKGVLRFHAVYWPALLLSAGLPLPTEILVHDYLTVDGQKISKSTGTGVGPVALAHRYGTDALRWWLLREVPRVGDADFTEARLLARANADLAGGVGNLVHRVTTLARRHGCTPASPAPTTPPGDGPSRALTGTPNDLGPRASTHDAVPPAEPHGTDTASYGAAHGADTASFGVPYGADPAHFGAEHGADPGRRAGAAVLGDESGEVGDPSVLVRACRDAPGLVDSALARADFRQAAGAVWAIVEEANRYLEQTLPWELARDGHPVGGILGVLVGACQVLGTELAPFVPDTAARVRERCTPVDGILPALPPVFPRLEP
ncbi:methionine--tRNA ligase [Longispora sp. NPDC051575]|uniref:methionine--tRNA ligase n=1 Tax=Longispora sp. NPDC051575 TaxID=3154943 RepID=UPI0034219832